jgi:RimJ/RimL family protein N-acetyltransferase
MADLKAYIEARSGRSDVLFLGIFTRPGGAHIGNIKYEPVDELAGYAVMGILIGEPAWRGRDVAGEVITASAAWLAAHRNIREFVLGVQRDHEAAISAYRRIGFRVEATRRIAARAETVTMVWRPQSAQRAAS